jgi:hypothetical protein
MATLDIESIALALEHNMITPFQAVQMMWGRDVIGFFGKDNYHATSPTMDGARGHNAENHVR